MTGIAGFVDRTGGDPAAPCARMLAALRLYGPDGVAQEETGDAALGRALFRTVPEDRFDAGPVSLAGGTQLLAFDGRLDNRDELLAGEPGARLSDAALAARVLEAGGEEALVRLIGDWALIWWDTARRRLLLARDPLGARPLFFHRGQGFAAAASMPKGLHALPQVPRAVDAEAIARQFAVAPETGTAGIWQGIERVPPGHLVAIDPAGVAITRFWSGAVAPVRFARDEDYAHGLAAQLDRAVAARLRRLPGKGVGSHLSAGYDSSAVTTAAARLLGAEPLVAYTAVPDPDVPLPADRLGDEGAIAAAVAARCANVEHVLIRTAGRSPLPQMDDAFLYYDRPIPNPCNHLWMEAIHADARGRGIGVLLNGQSGNFTISNDGTPHLAELVAQRRWRALARLVRQLRANGMRRRSSLAHAIGAHLPPRLWQRLADATGRTIPLADVSAMNPHSAAAQQTLALDRTGTNLTSQPWADGAARVLWGLGRFDLGSYNKGILGAWGLDFRDPTADRRLLEYCLAIPQEQFLLNGELKSLVRRAFGDRLPPALLAERRKGYQGADWYLGLAGRRDEVADALDALENVPGAEVIDLPRLRRLVDEWPQTPAQWAAQSQSYRNGLLCALSAAHFLRRASGANR